MGKIKAIIFDMDGVLTDSEPLINMAAVKMFKELNLDVKSEDFHPFIGAGEERYIGGVAEKYNFPVDLKTAKKRTYEIYLELVPDYLTAFPGAVEFVKQCRHSGFKTALASSADLIKIAANLKKIGIPMEGWDCVVSAEDVMRRKPAPDIFLKTAEKLNLEPQECVVIEDAVNGVLAAKAAGMPCIAVCHTFDPGKLKDADLIVPAIKDINIDMFDNF